MSELTGNHIKVPDNFKHMLRKEQDDISPEYVVATIRDYIKAHPNVVITGEKFVEITNRTTAGTYVKRLMEQGKVTRTRVNDGRKGHRFTYEWNEVPVLTEYTKKLEIKPKVRQYTKSGITIEMLREKVFNIASGYTPEQVFGMITLVNEMDAQVKRDKKKEEEDNSGGN